MARLPAIRARAVTLIVGVVLGLVVVALNVSALRAPDDIGLSTLLVINAFLVAVGVLVWWTQRWKWTEAAERIEFSDVVAQSASLRSRRDPSRRILGDAEVVEPAEPAPPKRHKGRKRGERRAR